MNTRLITPTKMILTLSICLLISACIPNLSIFEWRITAPDTKWIEVGNNDEFYMLVEAEEEIDGIERKIRHLKYYQGKTERWSTPFPSLDNFKRKIIGNGDNQKLIMVSNAGSSVYIFDNQGNLEFETFDSSARLSSFSINEQGSLAGLSNATDAEIKLFINGNWVTTSTLAGSAVSIVHSGEKWAAITSQGTYYLDKEGIILWSLPASHPETFTTVVSDSQFTVVRTETANSSGLLFFNNETGAVTEHDVSSYKLHHLSNESLPVITQFTDESESKIIVRAINIQGEIASESHDTYNNVIQILPTNSNQLAILHRTTTIDDDQRTDSYSFDVLGSTGNLIRQYSATSVITKIDPDCSTPITSIGGPIQFPCYQRLIQPGYTISQGFIDDNNDLYAQGQMIYSGFTFPAKYPYIGKVNPLKTTP